MRNKLSGKVAIIGILAMTILVIVLLIVPGIAAEDVDNLMVDMENETCDMLGIPAAIPILPVDAKKIKTVETSSTNGNIIYKCTSEKGAIENNTGTAIQYRSEDFYNVSCNIPVSGGGVEISNDWHQEISSSGNATLTCKIPTN